MKRGYLISLLGVTTIVAVSLWVRPAVKTFADQGWGIDACVTAHLQPGDRSTYLKLLTNSGVRVLRERDVGKVAGTPINPGRWHRDMRKDYRLLKKNGFAIVAFAYLPFSTRKPQLGNQLPEDLRHVHQQGQFLGREYAGLVDAWEMVGEPDIGYCTDLPDRVAAYQKALYLGLKAGAREARRQLSDGSYSLSVSRTINPQPSTNNGTIGEPIVLMGALGMPPGPWLERAEANGLLDYTDAYNFHFYGHAEHLTGVIEAHRAAIVALMRPEEKPGTENLKPESSETVAAASSRSSKAHRLEADATKSSSPQVSGFKSQVSATTSPLPLWITEAGLAAVDKKDFLNPQRRQLQADFTISTAKQALAAADVAVFMPFILVHDKDPHAMTLSANRTLPAWDAYAKFTRENPWPRRPLAREPHEPNPVVMQWLPDNRTCLPKKVSGTYRFRGREPIKGALRVYNFGSSLTRGTLRARLSDGSYSLLGSEQEHFRITSNGQPITGLGELEIPAMGMVSIPLEFTVTSGDYFRETFAASFVEANPQVSGLLASVSHSENRGQAPGGQPSTMASSQVSFGLEAWAKLADFNEEPLLLRALPDGVIRFPQIEPYAPGEQVGVWTTMNGLRVAEATDPQVSGLKSQVSGAARFWIEKENTDPQAPTLAMAGVDGLLVGTAESVEPGGASRTPAFLRLRLDKPMSKERKVLVILVDDRGQRYTIWENFGADYYGSRSDVWLSLEDFHADFWRPISADYRFRPERIREVHLRIYLDKPDDPVAVTLSLLKAKS